jgi:anti-anti-sigma factor
VDRPAGDRRRLAIWPHAHLELRLEGGVLVARVEGEVDLANVARVERVVMDAVARDRPRAVAVDLTALQYLDGAGRAWLLRLGERLAFCGVAVEIRRPKGGEAARMFDLLWLAGDELWAAR